MKKVFIALFLFALLATLCACGGDGGDTTTTAAVTTTGVTTTTTHTTTTVTTTTTAPVTTTAAPILITPVFEGESATYDGTVKTLAVTGLPDGASVTYSVNGGTPVSVVSLIDAGEYTIVANITLPTGYYMNATTVSATLSIAKATMPALGFENDEVEYDTYPHSIAPVGNVPAGATVVYYYNGEECDEVTEVGEYTVRCVITHRNYITYEATATLKIVSTEEELFSVVIDGVVYFQNNLDENKLYKYESGELIKVNNDNALYMMTDGTGLYYVGKGTLTSNIKYLDASGTSILCKVNAQSLATDGENIYYAVSSLIKPAENGIYRLALDGSDTAPVRITSDKAKYLVYSDGYIYYSNQSNGKKLCRVSASSSSASQGTVLFDEKVEYLIEDGGILYFDSTDGLLGGSAIRKYSIADGTCIKLTTDSGKYLTKIGSYIYYVNNDLLTSSFFGKTISRVSALATEDSSLPGSVVITDSENGYSSLNSDGEALYFYRLNDKHLYSYSIADAELSDLMEGFVPPVPTVSPLETHYIMIADYNGILYYIDPLNGDALYQYDLTTKRRSKVLDDAISGAWLHDGRLYYNSYTLTNYALYVMDLATGETVKLLDDRTDHLLFTDQWIYYIDVGSAYNNHIYKIAYDHDNEVDTPVAVMNTTSLWVADLFVAGDDVYFVNNKLFGGKKLHKFSLTSGTLTELDITALTFTVSGERIYYFDNSSKLKSCALDGSDVKTLVNNVNINDLTVCDGYLYYSSTEDTVGLYRINLSTNAIEKVADTPADGMHVVNGVLYYMQCAVSYTNDYPHIAGGDYHLYSYDGENVKKIS